MFGIFLPFLAIKSKEEIKIVHQAYGYDYKEENYDFLSQMIFLIFHDTMEMKKRGAGHTSPSEDRLKYGSFSLFS